MRSHNRGTGRVRRKSRTMSNVLMRRTFVIDCRQMQRYLAHTFKQSLRRAPPVSGNAIRPQCHVHSCSALAGT